MSLETTFGTSSPVIGMVHLSALPGAPGADESLDTTVEAAVTDAQALEAGGVDGLIVENFGDAPFFPDDVPKHTVAAMTRATRAVAEAVSIPVGVNVLRNDAEAALSVAAATGGAFVRVNVHTGARVTDQGLVEGRAHETMRLRDRLDADVGVFADIDVKHSAPLAEGSVRRELADACERGLADAVIVSGAATGEAVDKSALSAAVDARESLGLDVPILVGSGVDAGSVADHLTEGDGVIVGTALKEGGETTAPVSESRVAELVARADEVR